MTKRQRKALMAVQETLNAINEGAFWRKVMRRVGPLMEANERVRFKSYAAAHNKVLR